ncbi:MAG: hypothetical protein AB7R89_13665 [Dehalococcoidia bacterium]
MTITPNPLIPAGAQSVIAGLLQGQRNDSCVIQRPSSSTDGAGAPTGAVTTLPAVACQVRAPQRQPVESVGGARFAAVVDYEVRFPPDTDVRSEDLIVVNGRTLRVIADRDAISHGFELVVMTKAVEA